MTRTKLQPPPLFAGFDTPAAPLSATAMVGGAGTMDWWDVGNAICNALADARTLDDIERIKAEHAESLRAMVAARRDIAASVSLAFQLRRQELGRK